MLIQVIKSRRVRWAGHVTCKGKRRGAYRCWWGDRRERDLVLAVVCQDAHV